MRTRKLVGTLKELLNSISQWIILLFLHMEKSSRDRICSDRHSKTLLVYTELLKLPGRLSMTQHCLKFHKSTYSNGWLIFVLLIIRAELQKNSKRDLQRIHLFCKKFSLDWLSHLILLQVSRQECRKQSDKFLTMIRKCLSYFNSNPTKQRWNPNLSQPQS